MKVDDACLFSTVMSAATSKHMPVYAIVQDIKLKRLALQAVNAKFKKIAAFPDHMP